MVMDTFFITHSSPTLCTDDSLPAWHFLKSFKQKVYSERPSSILVISAHWTTYEPCVNSPTVNDTIYDFNIRYPDEFYKLKYPAPGAPKLAQRVKELLEASGIKNVKEDKERGLDHGTWVVLMLMYPEADIPVCQLSVQPNESATYHYNLGKALIPLKEEGVLIIGSGGPIINLTELNFDINDNVTAFPWAKEFKAWLKEALLDGRYEDIIHYLDKGPNAKKAVTEPDHFYPLHVAIGAAGENAKAKLIHESWSFGCYSYDSYQFTSLDHT